MGIFGACSSPPHPLLLAFYHSSSLTMFPSLVPLSHFPLSFPSLVSLSVPPPSPRFPSIPQADSPELATQICAAKTAMDEKNSKGGAAASSASSASVRSSLNRQQANIVTFDLDYHDRSNGESAVAMAVRHGMLELACRLVDLGVDVTTRNKWGEGLLHTLLLLFLGPNIQAHSALLMELLMDGKSGKSGKSGRHIHCHIHCGGF